MYRTSKHLTTSGDVKFSHMKKWRTFILETAGINLQIPTPVRSLLGKRFIFVNTTSGACQLSRAAGFLGSANSITVEPYKAVMIMVNKVSSSYLWSVVDDRENVEVKSWTPTVTFATATPTFTTNTWKYWTIGGTVFFIGHLVTADGAGGSFTSATLPVTPYNVACNVPVQVSETIDGTTTDGIGYIDAGNATVESRVLALRNGQTWTDDKACSLMVSGFYEIYGWTAYTPTLTFGGGSTAASTEVGRYTVIGGTMYFLIAQTSADPGATPGITSVTVSLPNTPPDRNGYIACAAIQLVNTTYSNPLGYVDVLDNTGTNRIVKTKTYTDGVDNQAFGLWFAGCVELKEWTTWSATVTWSTADPGTVTDEFHYSISDGMCSFLIYLSSADGNASTDVVITPPVPCAYWSSGHIPLFAYQTQHTDVFVNPVAYIDADASDPDDRTIKVLNFTTADDGEAITVCIGGSYPVAA